MIKKHKALLAYMLVLAVFTTYVALDTFVITRVCGEETGNGTDAAMQLEADENVSESPGQDATSSGQDSEESVHKKGPGSGNGGPPSEGHGPGSGNGSGSGNGGPPSGDHGFKPGKPSKSMKSSKSGSSSKSSTSSSSSSSSASNKSSTASTSGSSGNSSTASSSTSAAVTQDSYKDSKISINLKEYTYNGSTVHVAEVSSDSDAYLKTAFAQGAYGKNVTATTSDIADSVNAILAINGDYYGAREKGYVIRNGKLYRNTADAGTEDLVIYKDGSFGIINESEVTAEELLAKGAMQTLSFGPALVENGKVSVDSDDEVDRAMGSNPRTAIGIKTDGTYLFVVSDGRTDESEGLSLLELAEFMSSLGAKTAYNLDGGGSSTMVFNGSVVNVPTGGGIGNGSGSERKVSDIVYIGY